MFTYLDRPAMLIWIFNLDDNSPPMKKEIIRNDNSPEELINRVLEEALQQGASAAEADIDTGTSVPARKLVVFARICSGTGNVLFGDNIVSKNKF